MPSQLTPMLASPSDNTDTEFRRLMSSGEWAADVKLDGIRAWAYWAGGRVVLFNRKRVDITQRFPEVVDYLTRALALEDPCVLDGEIVANDGWFETVLTRDKQTQQRVRDRMSGSHPCTFYAFDLPSTAGDYNTRRTMLDALALRTESVHPDGAVHVTHMSMSPDFLARTRTLGLEGVIAKRLTSRYEYDRRSPSWVKFKNITRVTCLVKSYEPGKGARAHFGAMHLLMLADDGTTVPVGRVGTGFRVSDTHALKARLDAGEQLVVEIECLNKTSGGQLRFPSYKGERTDVDASAATIHQLDNLILC